MLGVGRLCKENSLPAEITSVIMCSWREGTQSKYSSYEKRWFEFCSKQKIDPVHPPINQVLSFLHTLYTEGLRYSAINTARSMLSSFIIQDGVGVGKHVLVKRYLKGVENERPSLPKYSFTWDAGLLIRHYRNSAINDNLLDLSRKLSSMLAILSGHRAREALSLLDIRNITFEENFAILRIADPLKTSNRFFHNGEIKLPKYAEKSICPVTTLQDYINSTRPLRNEVTGLFITTTKPHKKASEDTLARWIKHVLEKAGVDISIFSPHSTRSASTSSVMNSVKLDTILKAGGWRSERTFATFYNKKILYDEEFSNSVVNAKNVMK